MKKSSIRTGVAYRRRQGGITIRTVIAIGMEHQPDEWLGDPDHKPTDEPGVLYEQRPGVKGTVIRERLFLSSFANWAGEVVESCPICDQSWPKPKPE